MDSVITIKTDIATKRVVQKLAKEMGLTLNDLLNNCLKQIVANQHIDRYILESMTPKLEKLLEEAEEEIKMGEISRPYGNIEDLLKDLHR